MANNRALDILFRKIAFNDDQDAFKELFFDFYPSLCVFAGRYITSPEICEDIVQDTFFYIWQNRKKIDVSSSFRNLLITSVKNRCTDYIRKQSVRQIYHESQSEYDMGDVFATPETVYTINELEEMLRNALDRLPDNVRKAFHLSRVENMTYNQIAQEMEVSPKTVEAYISKALNALRVELRDYLPLVLIISEVVSC